jgi:hypothetical protein
VTVNEDGPGAVVVVTAVLVVELPLPGRAPVVVAVVPLAEVPDPVPSGPGPPDAEPPGSDLVGAPAVAPGDDVLALFFSAPELPDAFLPSAWVPPPPVPAESR